MKTVKGERVTPPHLWEHTERRTARRPIWNGEKDSMNQYREMMQRQQREYNDFARKYIFYAFDKEQFSDGMKRFKLNPKKDQDKIVRIPGGGYCLKEKAADLIQLFKNQREEVKAACDADTTGNGFICCMFYAIMADHEYSYTRDIEEVIDNSPYTREEIQASQTLSHGIKEAARFITNED